MSAFGDYTVIPLGHKIKENHPVWPGRTRFCRKTYVQPGLYCVKENYEIGCDCCTHVDAPAHFIQGGRTITDISLQELTAPLVVVDATEQCRRDHLYELSVDDLKTWEQKHGQVPKGALVCMRSGWSSRFHDNDDYQNHQPTNHSTEYLMHFPGFSVAAAQWLLEQRDIAGLGIDTLSTDVGTTKTFPVHLLVLGAGKFQVENLDLAEAPEAGALAVVSPLQILNAPEAPATVVALVPKHHPQAE